MILKKQVTLPNCSVYNFNLRLCVISHTARTCPVHVASFHHHPSLGMGLTPNSVHPTYQYIGVERDAGLPSADSEDDA